jgi:hypothetical protein
VTRESNTILLKDPGYTQRYTLGPREGSKDEVRMPTRYPSSPLVANSCPGQLNSRQEAGGQAKTAEVKLSPLELFARAPSSHRKLSIGRHHSVGAPIKIREHQQRKELREPWIVHKFNRGRQASPPPLLPEKSY